MSFHKLNFLCSTAAALIHFFYPGERTYMLSSHSAISGLSVSTNGLAVFVFALAFSYIIGKNVIILAVVIQQSQACTKIDPASQYELLDILIFFIKDYAGNSLIWLQAFSSNNKQYNNSHKSWFRKGHKVTDEYSLFVKI